MAARPWRIVIAIFLFTFLAGAVYLIAARPRIPLLSPPLKPEDLFPYGEMRIGVDASYPPFAVATADDLFGLEIDLGEALAERVGIPVRFINMGYDGLYDSLRADQVDLVIATLQIDLLRTADVRYTRPYFNNGLVLVSPAESDIKSMSDLGGRKLAYEFGSDADQQARLWSRRILPFETQPYELPEYALDAVRSGLADAALIDAASVRLYLREHHDWQTQYHYVTDALFVIPMRIDRVETWAAVNDALQSLADDGTLDKIIQRWL
jgi:ABC-type amino acid transport substrate-binding protein